MTWLWVTIAAVVIIVVVRMMGSSTDDSNEPQGRYCINCNAKIPDGGVKCPGCGGRSFVRKGGKKAK